MSLAIDLFCGLGGWTEGFLAEGYRVIGFDIERHDYGTGGYPGQLVLQDVTTLHGSQFRNATVIVASPPCQAYSYRAMPWSRAKALPPPDNTLFEACFRIQQEAIAAAGRYIPLVVENVRGAQKWVGRAKANFGSYYLWGDVGMVGRRVVAGMPRFGVSVVPVKAHKVPGFRFDGSGGSFQTASVEATKNNGGSWFAIAHNTESGHSANPVNRPNEHLKWGDCNGKRFDQRPKGNVAAHREGYKTAGMNWSDQTLRGQDFTRIAGKQASGVKDRDADGYERNHPQAFGWKALRTTSLGNARKAASAAIAKIPFPLAQHIAQVFKAERLTT